MGWLVWAGLLPVCAAAFALLAHRLARYLREEFRVDRARDQFRLQREWLEARFLGALSRIDPVERLRWEDARWRDEIVWARDRQTRRLLALVGVEIDSEPFADEVDSPPRQATAMFEFRKGRWHAEGKRLDEIRPDEAFLRHGRFEPLALPHRRG
jgi:hypothetical protein